MAITGKEGKSTHTMRELSVFMRLTDEPNQTRVEPLKLSQQKHITVTA